MAIAGRVKKSRQPNTGRAKEDIMKNLYESVIGALSAKDELERDIKKVKAKINAKFAEADFTELERKLNAIIIASNN
jgi:ribosome-associated translation inhibitor RaiA